MISLLIAHLAFQAIVLQTNCPKGLIPGTIVAAQSVTSVANYPVVILACYTLDPNVFTIDNTTTPPTIRVTGSGGTANFVTNEVPSGSVNGSNVTFTLANNPIAGSQQLYLDGLRLTPTVDYTIVNGTITMLIAPLTGSRLLADYRD
jgi:hypothetical protein